MQMCWCNLKELLLSGDNDQLQQINKAIVTIIVQAKTTNVGMFVKM